MFHITVTEPQNVGYLIDLYTYESKSNENLPRHFGHHYLLANSLKNSEGLLELAIFCPKSHHPLGVMKLEFLKITPLANSTCNMKVTYEGLMKLNKEFKNIL